MANSPNALGSWAPDVGELWFSDRFNVDPLVLDKCGAYDISVVTDTPLFVDPFLLFNSEDDKYQALHEQMLHYLHFLKAKAHLPLPTGLVQNWFAFHEVKQNWLGFTEDGNAGHGLVPVSRATYAMPSRTCCAISGRRASPTPATWRSSPCCPTMLAATPLATSRPT